MSQLKEYLKSAREKKKLSQGAVAKALGYRSPQYVSNWERGMSLPPLKGLKKLTKIFSLDSGKLQAMLVKDYTEKLQKLLK